MQFNKFRYNPIPNNATPFTKEKRSTDGELTVMRLRAEESQHGSDSVARVYRFYIRVGLNSVPVTAIVMELWPIP